MPSLTERDRNNIRAGVFVSVTLIACLAVMIALSDVLNTLSRSTDTYTVTFKVSSGVANLKGGSDVRIGGVRMGRVLSVLPPYDDQAFREIKVKFNIDSRIKLYNDALILVTTPIIGSDAWLEIPNVGDPAKGTPPDGQLTGTSSLGLLTSMLGSENAGKASEMVENVRVLSEFLATVPDEYKTRVIPALDDIGATAKDARAVIQDLRNERWPHWAASVDRVMTWAVDVTPKLDAAIAEGHDLLANSNQVVQENREPIKSIVSDVKSVTNRFNTETVDKFHKLLDTGQESLDQARAALETFRVDYAGWATSVDEALANASLTAQQLKLASIETRRSPWKLLYRPSSDELQHELLYDATRSFALAVADLKATTDTVRRIMDEHGEAIAADPETFQRLQRNLMDSLSNYEKVQQKMLDVLVSDGKH